MWLESSKFLPYIYNNFLRGKQNAAWIGNCLVGAITDNPDDT